MIKFFRRIRQNLISEGKTGKPAFVAGRYIKYALGEIALVVIGILIALQINSIYADKIEQSEIESFLERLKIEYASNIEKADNLLHRGHIQPLYEQIELVDSAIISFQSGIKPSNIKYIMSRDLFWVNQFRLSRDVFIEGANSGLLFKIKNKDLIAEIQYQHANMIGRQGWIDRELENYHPVFGKAIKYRFMRPQSPFVISNSEINLGLENNTWLLDKNEESYQLAYLSITSWKNVVIARIRYLESEIDGNEKLISLINQELSK